MTQHLDIDGLARGAGRRSPLTGGATFGLRHRLARVAWSACWLLFARWTPPQLHAPRRWVLRAFGADIHPTAIVRSSVRIWWPGNLHMGAHASMGPGVVCYNVAPISIGDFAIVSQRAHLCTGTHDVDDPAFPLRARPISIGRRGWVAAEAFVGPGVRVGEGAVLGARGVAFRDLGDWMIYSGNPAVERRRRRVHN
jgi:putative colanic acid biosynthesis acetyltransferase WcaF